MRYVSIYNVLSKFRRDSSLRVEEADFIEWAAEALEAIGAAENLEEAVAFIEVKNYETAIPAGLKYVIQVALNQCEGLTPIETTTSSTSSEEASTPVPLDCNGTPITEYELAYYRPYFDLIYEYQLWTNSRNYAECWTPVRLADHTFFNSVVCQEVNTDIQSLYKTSEWEYTLNDPYMRFSFKEGQIAVSYLRTKVDENGYPQIPDNYSVLTAITKYVKYRLLERRYEQSDKPVDERRYMKAEQDWQWYCGQAGNVSMMPKNIDDKEDLLRQRTYLLPRQYRYYGFFGKRNQYERKVWDRWENRLLYRGYPISDSYR